MNQVMPQYCLPYEVILAQLLKRFAFLVWDLRGRARHRAHGEQQPEPGRQDQQEDGGGGGEQGALRTRQHSVQVEVFRVLICQIFMNLV